MIQINRYLSNKIKASSIKATNNTIKQIVKSELDRLGHDADLNHIDVSEVTDMNHLFCCAEGYGILNSTYEDLNSEISRWDVSNTKRMDFMFYKCKKFNCDISNWMTKNLENMNYMFYGCENFNQDLSQWDVHNMKTVFMAFEETYVKDNFMPPFQKKFMKAM